MNIKELAQKYKDEIPSSLSNIEFLKAVYFEFGKRKFFDEKYYFGNATTTKKIYTLARMEEHSTSDKEDKQTIICVSLSYQIKKLMQELGYTCIVTTPESIGDHIFPIIVLPDGRNIKYDLQSDLSNIQMHCRTQFFGTADTDDPQWLSKICDDEQLKIDQAVGYIDNSSEYNDSILENLDFAIKNDPNLSVWEKLDIIFSNQDLINTAGHAGYVEAYKFYTKKVLPRYFQPGRVNVIICSRINEEGSNSQYTNCIYAEDIHAPEAVYLFSRVHNRYILTPFQKIAELEEEGLVIGRNSGGGSARKLKKRIAESVRSISYTTSR